jgi:AcrR family transcriptional regulator
MGPVNSATWSLLLDGAENILKEEGYASLTSRRIAERVGIKQQLTYYYFRTMDDLMVEAFRRLSKRELARLETALSSDRPLHEFWSVCSNTSDARLISEFMALAHRSEGVKNEVVDFIEQSRRMQTRAIAKSIKTLRTKSGVAALPPVAITFLTTSIALALTRESALGITTAHREIKDLVKQCLSALEPAGPQRPSVKRRSTNWRNPIGGPDER